jgi:hypothetical protein
MYKMKFSEEHRRKIGEANRRRIVSDETKRKISESRKKLFSESDQAHINLKTALKGLPSKKKGRALSEEMKQKISNSRKGKGCGEANCNYHRNFSEEHRKKIGNARKGIPTRFGIPQPDSAKEKIRLSRLGTKASPETKLKLSLCRKGSKNSNWKGGRSFGRYCPKFDDKFKENVRNFFGGKCVICGKTEKENGNTRNETEKLSVHHVFTEKMVCCETKIQDMENVRRRLPKEIAQYGNPKFSALELQYIRMMVPLCRSDHGFAEGEDEDIEFEKSEYRKFFVDVIMNKYNGKCYTEESK